MFANFDKIGDEVMADCDKSVITRRIPYTAIYTAIEEYINKHRLIVSMQGRLLKSMAAGMFVYDVFCQDCTKTANALANILSELSGYVEMSTKLARQKLIITIRCVLVATFYALPNVIQGPAIAISEIFTTTNLPGRFCSMLHFSNEIELIEVYHRLYCLHSSADWPDLAARELDMYATITHKRGGRRKQYRGQHSKVQEAGTKTEKKHIGIAEYIATAMHSLAGMAIYIGETAKALLSNKTVTRLQGITWHPIAVAMTTLNGVFGRELSVKKCTIDAPFDVRLRRYTVSIGKHVLIELYNSAKYEPIPVVRFREFMIGNAYVLLRFVLLEMYLIKFLHAVNRLHSVTADALRLKLLSMLLLFRDAPGILTTDYVGTYTPLSVYEKKQQAAVKIKRYVPRLYKLQNGIYRLLKSDSRQ